MTTENQPPAQAPAQAPTPPTPPQQAPQNPPPPQAAPPTPPATPPVAPPPAAPAPPALTPQQITDLQRSQTEAQRKITEQGQQLAQQRQQLAQLVGAQPQPPTVDPIQPYVEMLVKQGYDEKDARAIAGVSHAMMQPVIQAQQQAQAAIQGSAMVGQVMQEAWSTMPQVFAPNAQIGQNVQRILQSDALAGRPIDKDYALNLAKIEWANAQFSGQPTQPPAAPPPNFNFMSSPQPGFTAPAPTTQAPPPLSPEQQRWTEDIKKTFKTDAR